MESSADRFRGKVAAVLGLLLATLWGCSAVPSTAGEQRLADATFLKVLLDMHMVEGAMNTVGAYEVNTRRDSLTAKLYSEILDRHKVKAEDFNQTLLYYQNHPSEFEVMYDSLIAPIADSAAKVRARMPEVKALPVPSQNTPDAAQSSAPASSPTGRKREKDTEKMKRQREEIQQRLREQNQRLKRNKNASGGTGAN